MLKRKPHYGTNIVENEMVARASKAPTQATWNFSSSLTLGPYRRGES
jgi:hypothetical protein